MIWISSVETFSLITQYLFHSTEFVSLDKKYFVAIYTECGAATFFVDPIAKCGDPDRRHLLCFLLPAANVNKCA